MSGVRNSDNSRDLNGKKGMTQSRIPELDGLRGIAILLVLLYHYIAVVPGGQLASSLSRFQRLFSLDWIGVDLFFVLSGFLIGGILLNFRESPSYFRTFYTRRFFRIFPLYYGWIFAYVLLMAIAGHQFSSHDATAPQDHLSLAKQFFFMQNLTFGEYPGAFVWFSTTWSLAVEEQFYLVSPFLVRFLSTRPLSMVLGSAVLAAPFIRMFVRSHMAHGYYMAYALTPSRVDDLAFGMLVAVAWRNPSVRQWLSSHVTAIHGSLALLCIGALGWWKWATDPFDVAMQRVGYTWIGLLFTALLLALLVRPASLLGWVTRMRWLRELGKVAYCVYIVHQTVNFLCHLLITGNTPQISDWSGAFATLCAVVLTYGIAKLSWIVLENPLLRYGHGFRYAEPPKAIQRIDAASGVLDSRSVPI